MPKKNKWESQQRGWKLELIKLGIKQSEFCRLIKESEFNFSKWVNGKCRARRQHAEKVENEISRLKKEGA